MSTEKLPPVHPGEILLEEFIKPLGTTQNRVSLAIGVSAPRINAIARGKRAITADTALRLARYFGTSPGFWLTLQSRYDLDVEMDHIGDQLNQITPLQPA